MTLEIAEQIALGNGADFWSTKAVADVPSIVVTDGPHGLRKQEDSADHLGIGESVLATCFPPAVGLSQTWDLDLAREIGAALGHECQAAGVGVLLGPGINIKRDPRCGRNFEYFSEDPLLSGALGAAWVSGLQGAGVGASLKHFAANNAENDRMRSSSDIDDRPLREIYLRAFQRVVEESQPWSVMCSYNRINGVYSAENHWLLTTVLRHEWGFQGAVISDWSAVDDRVAAMAAGLDLAMPGGDTDGDKAVLKAVESGELSRRDLQRSADAVATLADRVTKHRRDDVVVDLDAHHALARKAASRGLVLLKNEHETLPLAPGLKIAVIGEFALKPQFQGGGSSRVNAARTDIPLEEIRATAPSSHVEFAPGFSTDLASAATLLAEATQLATDSDAAVVFVGVEEGKESEGYDREDLELDAQQIQLVLQVAAAQPRTVVVVSHGGVLRLAPIAAAPAVLDAALLGQGVGSAIAAALFGVVNPSGKLAETVPVRLQDAPSYLDFQGDNSRIRYGEGIFVGYRWYDARDMDVTYPFGHGLSYTDFTYSDLCVASTSAGVDISFTITNTGRSQGREVAQVYIGAPDSLAVRATRELKGFASVDLEAGESKKVEIRVRRQDLTYWDTRVDRWVVAGGNYAIAVGSSSRDLRLSTEVLLEGDVVRAPLTHRSTVGEVIEHPSAGPRLRAAMPAVFGDGAQKAHQEGVDIARLVSSIPIGRMTAGPANLDPEFIAELLVSEE